MSNILLLTNLTPSINSYTFLPTPLYPNFSPSPDSPNSSFSPNSTSVPSYYSLTFPSTTIFPTNSYEYSNDSFSIPFSSFLLSTVNPPPGTRVISSCIIYSIDIICLM